MYYLSEPGVQCALGSNAQELRTKLVTGREPVPLPAEYFTSVGSRWVAQAQSNLAPLTNTLSSFDCRNNRLAASALEQIQADIDTAINKFGRSRIGVVMATSTSGISSTEEATKYLHDHQRYPIGYHAKQGVLAGLAEFVSEYLGTTGPSFTLSTACASSASAILSARRLLSLDLCDVVVVGGSDSLCEMTLQGFASLEALSSGCCKPFCNGRDGINLGEAAAIFLLGREPTDVALLGGAASADAHHISAPHPEGEGAFQAMSDALLDANLAPTDIDYLNLHGTGTIQNDKMESKAVNKLFGDQMLCSSTKSMTGHTLGTSGTLELSICYLLLTQTGSWRMPPSLYTELWDESLAPLRLTTTGADRQPERCLSNSFAFGGNNVSLIVGRSNA